MTEFGFTFFVCMNCSFLSGELSSIPDAALVSLRHPYVAGSRVFYYSLTEGIACMQEWEVGDYQLIYCSARLEEPTTMEVRHAGHCASVFINLSGNLLLTEAGTGKQLIGHQSGIIFWQDYVQGFCTQRSLGSVSRILLICHPHDNTIGELPVLPYSPPMPFVITRSIQDLLDQMPVFSIDTIDQLFSEAVSVYRDLQNKPLLTEQEFSRIRELKTWIDTHLGEVLTMDTLTNKAGIDKWKLRAGFYFLVEKQLFEYIRVERLLNAHEKIISTQWPLKRIGKSAGYHSYPNFSSAFKTYFGYTPVSLRKL